MTLYPFLFGMFFILSLYFTNIRLISYNEIIFPLLLVLSIIGIFLFLISKVLKNNFKSALIISLFVIIFFTYGHMYLEINNSVMDGINGAQHRYLLIPFLAILIFGTFLIIKTKRNLEGSPKILNLVSLTMVVIVLFNIGLFNIENFSNVDVMSNSDTSKILENPKKLPNIYYIIFDGYPGYHSLKISDIDNEQFYEYFKSKGFFGSKTSFSNYQVTHLSIPSSLNMEYLHPLANVNDGRYDQRIFHLLGNDNKLMSYLKSNGYTIINFDSGWGFSRDMKHADLQLCGDNQFMNSEFIIMLAKTSLLNPVYVKLFENSKVEMQLCVFDELPLIPERNPPEPYFVFAHILIPHAPYLFGPNGEILSIDNLNIAVDDVKHKSLFMGQVNFVNKKLPNVIDQLIDSPNPPIIVIQSDHGSSFLMGDDDSIWKNPDEQMLLERMNNINLIYLPSQSYHILSENVSPVNTFRLIFNNYLNADFEILPDNSYIFNGTGFEDVTFTYFESMR